MDPDTTLAVMRQATHYLTDGPPLSPEHYTDVVEQLIEAVEAMDEWLSHAGLLPSDWQGAR